MDFKKVLQLTSNTPVSHAVVNVTDACNLRCKYCFTDPNPSSISMETLQKLAKFLYGEMDKASYAYKPSIAFFGGEPLLEFDLIENFIIWCEREYPDLFTFSITTNGTLLNLPKLAFLRHHNVGLLLSIDGDKETQDAQRPTAASGSSFDMIDIPLILKFYPDITFRSTVQPENADKILSNYLFAKDAGFKHYYITPNVYTEWTDEQINIAMNEIWAISHMMFLDFEHGEEPCIWSDIIDNIIDLFTYKQDEKIQIMRCGLGTLSVGVATDGELYACQEHNTYHDKDDIFHVGDLDNGINRLKQTSLINYYITNEAYCIDDPFMCSACLLTGKCHHHGCPSRLIGNTSKPMSQRKVACIWYQTLANIGMKTLKDIMFRRNNAYRDYLMEVVDNNERMCGV